MRGWFVGIVVGDGGVQDFVEEFGLSALDAAHAPLGVNYLVDEERLVGGLGFELSAVGLDELFECGAIFAGELGERCSGGEVKLRWLLRLHDIRRLAVAARAPRGNLTGRCAITYYRPKPPEGR